MKLQLALDAISADDARAVLDEIHGDVDILEFGTPFLLTNGIGVIEQFRQRYPDLEFLADIKIMDGGEYMANLAFSAGASYVTVLGVARDETIAGAVKATRAADGVLFADLLATKDPAQRAVELERLGVDGVCVHTGFEPGSGAAQLSMLKTVAERVTNADISVAGGISADTLGPILEHRPDVVIVGGAITGASNPKEAVARIRGLATTTEADR